MGSNPIALTNKFNSLDAFYGEFSCAIGFYQNSQNSGFSKH